MEIHFLKSRPQFFPSLKDHSRPFEVRFNDRNFSPGDLVVFSLVELPEWTPPDEPTDDAAASPVVAVISSVLPECPGLSPGYVVLSLAFLDVSALSVIPPVRPVADLPAPSYYDVNGLSVLEILFKKLSPVQFEGFLLGNSLKYGLRLNWKPLADNLPAPSLSDARKMRSYSYWFDRLLSGGHAAFGAFVSRFASPELFPQDGGD